jgi:SPP1 gp7 family putative phage head morphogenesis protein
VLTGHGAIAGAMEEAVSANVDLITSIPEQYLESIREVVSKSFETGQRWESMVEEIQARGDVTETRAKIIARDQTSKMNASFNGVRQKGLGIDKYKWSTSHDERVRESHAELDGLTFRWDSPPNVDGENVHPGEAILCRCLAEPVFDLDEVRGGGQEAEAA